MRLLKLIGAVRTSEIPCVLVCGFKRRILSYICAILAFLQFSSINTMNTLDNWLGKLSKNKSPHGKKKIPGRLEYIRFTNCLWICYKMDSRKDYCIFIIYDLIDRRLWQNSYRYRSENSRGWRIYIIHTYLEPACQSVHGSSSYVPLKWAWRFLSTGTLDARLHFSKFLDSNPRSFSSLYVISEDLIITVATL